MDIISLFFIAVGLSMDSFAISVTNGITYDNFTRSKAVLSALSFGLFQFAMPIIGWLLGTGAHKYISAVDHWIAFGLLAFLGGKMIFDSVRSKKDPEGEDRGIKLTCGKIIIQGLATSIDALAVGITFAALGLSAKFSLTNINIWSACLLIGVVAFIIPLIGGFAGKKAGSRLQNKAGIVGGVVLIAIGIKILIEHLFFS